MVVDWPCEACFIPERFIQKTTGTKDLTEMHHSAHLLALKCADPRGGCQQCGRGFKRG